jgi:predicted nucleic acid-binding protein
MLSYEVDRGEAEAIVLAIEENIQRILIDDNKGRRTARKEGLTPLGTVGVLLIAKEKGLIPDVRLCLDTLIDNDIRFSESLYNAALQKAQEIVS